MRCTRFTLSRCAILIVACASICRAQQASGTRLPFFRMRNIPGMQVVFSAPGMGIDEQEPLVLACERAQDFEQQHVLVHVGEVSCVVLVAVFHGSPERRALIHVGAGRNIPQASGGAMGLGGDSAGSGFSAGSPLAALNGIACTFPGKPGTGPDRV